MDYIKGIAVILVIVYHIYPLSQGLQCVFSTLHNSLFFWASGMLLTRTAKNNIFIFAINKGKRTIYPFAVWVVILGILYSYTNSVSIMDGIYRSINGLWFLPSLMCAFIIVYIMDYWSNIGYGKVVLGGLIFIIIFCSILFSSAIGKLFFYSLLLYLAQKTVMDIGISLKKNIVLGVIYIICCVALFGTNYIVPADIVTNGYKLLFFFGISMLGTITIGNFAWLIDAHFHLAILSFLGRNSIYYYVLHTSVIYFFSGKEKTYAWEIFLAFIFPTMYCLLLRRTVINKILFGDCKK